MPWRRSKPSRNLQGWLYSLGAADSSKSPHSRAVQLADLAQTARFPKSGISSCNSQRLFDWGRYLDPLLAGLTDIRPAVRSADKSKMTGTFARLSSRTTPSAPLICSFTGVVVVRHKDQAGNRYQSPSRIDISYTYLDFPLDFEVCHQSTQQLRAEDPCAACGPYIKGRDWYDFNRY